MEYISAYQSPVGEITLASDGEKLTGLWFVGQKYYASTLSENKEMKNLPVFEGTARWLDIYFGGGVPDFTLPLLLRGTAFQKEIWEILLQIPYGKVMTYGQIAELFSKAGIKKTSARAVGSAVARNPVSIIVPCHRVMGSGGRLTGYAGGIEVKAYLLKLEGLALDPQ